MKKIEKIFFGEKDLNSSTFAAALQKASKNTHVAKLVDALL